MSTSVAKKSRRAPKNATLPKQADAHATEAPATEAPAIDASLAPSVQIPSVDVHPVKQEIEPPHIEKENAIKIGRKRPAKAPVAPAPEPVEEFVPELESAAEPELELPADSSNAPEEGASKKLTRFQKAHSSLSQEVSKLEEALKEELEKYPKDKFLAKLLKRSSKIGEYVERLSKTKVKSTGNGSKAASGLAKPVQVSGEIADFAGWAKDELHSRNEVTKFLCSYVKEQNLQDPADKRHILPDSRLQGLLQLKPGSVLTFSSLQTYLVPHFIKKT